MADEFVCEICETELKGDENFCPACGTLFEENIFCTNHSDKAAEGVCLVCQKSFCKKCGKMYNGYFLCDEDSEYEIYEGMAKVYGSNDHLQINYYKEILEHEGFHPFIYSRKSNSLHLGAPDFSLFRPAGDSPSILINEFKLLVPLGEVLKAEEILNEIIGNGR